MADFSDLQKVDGSKLNVSQRLAFDELGRRGTVDRRQPTDSLVMEESGNFGGIPVNNNETGNFGGIPVFESSFDNIEEPIEPKELNWFERIGQSWSKRIERTKDFAQRLEKAQQEKVFPNAMEEAKGELGSMMGLSNVMIGQVLGGVGDVLGETMISSYKTFMPEKTQQDIRDKLIDFAQTEVGQLGIEALNKGQEAYADFKEKYPDGALILESHLNILGTVVGTKGASLTTKELGAISDDVLRATSKILPDITEQQVKRIVAPVMSKAVKPKGSKGATFAKTQQFNSDASNAVQSIVRNKHNLELTDELGNVFRGLPTNLSQFSEAIAQIKRKLFQQYDEIAELAGQQGARVDITKGITLPDGTIQPSLIDELDNIINHPGLRAVNEDIVTYATRAKKRLLSEGSLSAKDAQDAIASLNNKLGSMKDYNSASKSAVDSLIANRLRTKLSAVIDEATGKSYDTLKKEFGTLKAIERVVSTRAFKESQKSMKGLIDFFDIHTGAKVVEGIISMNPAKISSGLMGKMLTAYTKALNDPNKMVKNMFTQVDDIMTKQKRIKGPFRPQSKVIQKIINTRPKVKKEN